MASKEMKIDVFIDNVIDKNRMCYCALKQNKEGEVITKIEYPLFLSDLKKFRDALIQDLEGREQRMVALLESINGSLIIDTEKEDRRSANILTRIANIESRVFNIEAIIDAEEAERQENREVEEIETDTVLDDIDERLNRVEKEMTILSKRVDNQRRGIDDIEKFIYNIRKA